jgi:small subunit ribosomal protein S1
MDFQIISKKMPKDDLLVSIKRIQYTKPLGIPSRLWLKGRSLGSTVIGVNRGGAVTSSTVLGPFLPGSHFSRTAPRRRLDWQNLAPQILEVNSETNKLVVSNRKAVVEQQCRLVLRRLGVGMVKALKPYSAFVVGGIGTFAHFANLVRSYRRPRKGLGGMKVKCMIIDHDKVNGRIVVDQDARTGTVTCSKDPDAVPAKAEVTAGVIRIWKPRQAREVAARDIVLGLERFAR